MEFFEVINKRGSYRGNFTDDRIPEADIRQILEAGIKAPSGLNMQPVTFVAITDEEIISRIAELMPSPATKSAKAMIAVATEVIVKHGASFEIEDYGAAVENVLLALTAKGYAGVWMDGQSRGADSNPVIREILNVPDHMTLRTIIPFGVPAEEVSQKEKKPFEERVVFNRF